MNADTKTRPFEDVFTRGMIDELWRYEFDQCVIGIDLSASGIRWWHERIIDPWDLWAD